MSTLVRLPIGNMNYPGDVRPGILKQIESGAPMGPNYLGEQMWPVEAEYDAEKNVTRVGFTLIPPMAVTQ